MSSSLSFWDKNLIAQKMNLKIVQSKSSMLSDFSFANSIQIDDQLIEYFRVEHPRTHDVAVAACDHLPGVNIGEFTLPVPSSQRENDFYVSLLEPGDRDTKGRARFWLGITRTGNGAWKKDSNDGPLTFSNWNTGEGTDVRAFSVAAAMLKSNGDWLGEWLDLPNDSRSYVVICTKKTKVSKCKNL